MQMSLGELLRLREIAAFLFGYIESSERASIAASSGKPYEDNRIVDGTSKILEIFDKRNQAERGGSMSIPEGAPLDFFTFFDQWQEVNRFDAIEQ